MDEKLDSINVVSGFDALRKQKLFLDFTIRIGAKKFKVHKLLLAASSEYFRAMFSHDTIEVEQNEATLQEIEPEIMENVLDFCYTGHTDLNNENVTDVLLVASRLQISTLQEACCRQIEQGVDDDNCLTVLSLADRIKLDRLMDRPMAHCCANFHAVTARPEIVLIDGTLLGRIIRDDRLAVKNEVEVLDLILKWVTHDQLERRQYLDDLLAFVRFALMDPLTLVKTSANDLLQDSPVGMNQIENAKIYHLLKWYPKELDIVKDKITIQPRDANNTAKIHGSRLFLINSRGRSQIYDEGLDVWREDESSFPEDVIGAAVCDGYVYAIGFRSFYPPSFQRFDLKKRNGWSVNIPCLPEPTRNFKVVALNGCIYALGGEKAGTAVGWVQKYDPRTNIWTKSLHGFITPRHSFGAAVHNGTIYIAGGVGSNDRALDSVESMNADGQWESVASMNLARSMHSLCSCQGLLYAIGGQLDQCKSARKAEYFDEQHNLWRCTAQMIHDHYATEAAVIGGGIYAIEHTEPKVPMEEVSLYFESYNPSTRVWTRKTNVKRRSGNFCLVSISP